MAKTRYIALVSVPSRLPRPNKRRPPSGNFYGGSGRLYVQSFSYFPENPAIIEESPEGTFVFKAITSAFDYDVSLIDDAGGRFKVDGRNIVAGPVRTDYEVATSHTIIMRAGTGTNQTDKSVTIQVIDIEDGPGNDSHYLYDQDLDVILDQDGNVLWD